jgi:hypothetical protein
MNLTQAQALVVADVRRDEGYEDATDAQILGYLRIDLSLASLTEYEQDELTEAYRLVLSAPAE